VVRVATRWGEGKPRHFLKTLIALLTTLRGTAFLYQGEELGLPQVDVPFERLQDPEGITFWPGYKGRDGCRTPMPWDGAAVQAGFSPVEPWLPVDGQHLPLAVDRQEVDPDSLLAFTRRWLAWRKTRAVLKTGPLTFIDLMGRTLAFIRGDGPDRLLFLFNLGDEPTRTALPAGAWSSPFDLGGVADAHGVTLPPGAGFVAQLGAA
jgi:alpha-glucosidase